MALASRKIRPLRVALVSAAMLLLVLAGSALYVHWPVASGELLALESALWVCDAPMQNFYPPGSPEAAAVVAHLASTGLDVKARKYRHQLCLRILGPDAPPDAAAIWGPFDPENPTPFRAAQR